MMDHDTEEKLKKLSEAVEQESGISAAATVWAEYLAMNDPVAQFHAGCLYLRSEQHRAMGWSLLVASNETGFAAASFELYFRMEGEQRYRMLERAANLGLVEAQTELGALYATGDWDGSKDVEAALFWYGKAAAAEYASAQYNLGLMLAEQGEVESACSWLERAGHQGHMEAIQLLIYLYEHHPLKISPERSGQLEFWRRELREREDQDDSA